MKLISCFFLPWDLNLPFSEVTAKQTDIFSCCLISACDKTWLHNCYEDANDH